MMGLIEKFKNLFTDEEEIIETREVEPQVNEINMEPEKNKLPTFMREKIEREEQEIKTFESEQEPKQELAEPIIEQPQSEENIKFKFPIEMEEPVFTPPHRENKQLIPKEKEPPKKKSMAELYGSKKEKKTVNKFNPTPIISPVYGVLDKNYKKEEVKVKEIEQPCHEEKIEQPIASKKVDFESVRRKAFGSLIEEVQENSMCENCELLKEVKRLEKVNENSLLYETMEEISEEKKSNPIPSFDEVSKITKTEENYYDYGLDYEPTHGMKETSFKSNSLSEPSVEIVNHNDNNQPEEIQITEKKSNLNILSTLKKSMGEPVKETPSIKNSAVENLELTDDLFDLIDSMYEERKED